MFCEYPKCPYTNYCAHTFIETQVNLYTFTVLYLIKSVCRTMLCSLLT